MEIMMNFSLVMITLSINKYMKLSKSEVLINVISLFYTLSTILPIKVFFLSS